MTTHTPGPWKAIKPPKVGKHWKVGARGQLGGGGAIGGATCLWNIAMIDNGAPGDTLDTEEANARLIAAAPELLVACKQMVAEGECYCADNVAARGPCGYCVAVAAIAAAEGNAPASVVKKPAKRKA